MNDLSFWERVKIYYNSTAFLYISTIAACMTVFLLVLLAELFR